MNLNATIFGQTIAFFLFVGFCMKYIWPPLTEAIEKRQKEISDSLAAAEHAKRDLQIAKEEASNLLIQAKKEAREIIEHAHKYKERVVNETTIQAKIERKNILEKARLEIEEERQRIIEELRNHVSTLVLSGIEKVIQCSIDKTTSDSVIDQVISLL